jgi:hypothetical protein
MRIVLEPTTDGRWQVLIDEWPIEAIPPGEWYFTGSWNQVRKTLDLLVGLPPFTESVKVRRRTKGSGG